MHDNCHVPIDLDRERWCTSEPTEFWAKFVPWGQRIIRLDTRIYLAPILLPGREDHCVGAIIGKNPGSAIRSDGTNSGLQPILLDGDKLLPTVRNIVKKSFEKANKKPGSNAYVQVLNLFYVCEPNLRSAIRSLQEFDGMPTCETENFRFPWVWYVWGDACEPLDRFKERYALVECDVHFYFDKRTGEVVSESPGVGNFAKHTQGLAQKPIVEYLSDLLARTIK